MASNKRILNLSTKRTLKRSQAIGRVEQCISAWVKKGEDGYVPNEERIRDLSLAESIALRSKQARESEELDRSELPGLTFKPPIGAQAAHVNEMRQAFEANRFYSAAVQ